ncbi:MAG: S8 family peptidase [Cyclobacteriaceae bacterium]|nr:S8 family peptidase [Cyclobacteriaceae bacterium]
MFGLFLCSVMGMQAWAQKNPKWIYSKKDSDYNFRVVVSDSLAFKNWAHTYSIKYSHSGKKSIWNVTLSNSAQVKQAEENKNILIIDKAMRKASPEKDFPQIDIQANGIQEAALVYPNVRGNGLSVSVKEEPFDANDADLKGRIIPFSATMPPVLHATTMASIIAGGKNSSTYSQGVAPGARIGFSSFTNLFPDEPQTFIANSISVQNHSYGVGVENYYGVESLAYDEQVFSNPTLIHVFSAGNSGDKPGDEKFSGVIGYGNLTGQFKTAKHVITVGGTNAFQQIENRSSRGPASDGRIKPELSAMGAGGTSEAAALVSGAALLIQNLFYLQHHTMPPASLVRACLLNTAIDRGRPELDFDYGYGTMHVKKALDVINNNQYLLDTLKNNTHNVHTLQIPDGKRKLKIMLAWTDPPPLLSNSIALVNNLDLQVLAPDGVYLPWILRTDADKLQLQAYAFRARDTLNVQEQITIDNPIEGSYQLTVMNDLQLPHQPYSITYTYEEFFSIEAPVANQTIEAGKPFIVRWQYGGSAPITCKIKKKNETAWQIIGTANNAQTLVWNTPIEEGTYDFLFSDGADEWLAENILISKIPNLQIAFLCDAQAGFTLPDSGDYEIYVLAEKYLHEINITSEIFFELPATNSVSVKKMIDGRAGLQSVLLTPDANIHFCYIKNFLPVKTYTDTASFAISLGTTIGVAVLTLERKVNESFLPVAQTSSGLSTDFQLTDTQATVGQHIYRLKLQTQSGNTIYSQEESIFVLDDNTIRVFPNPVKGGEILSVVINAEEETEIKLFDFSGRAIALQSDNAQVKAFDTSGLLPGIYLLKATSKNGLEKQTKILIR